MEYAPKPTATNIVIANKIDEQKRSFLIATGQFVNKYPLSATESAF